MTAFPANIKSMLTRRFALIAGMLMLASITVSACAVQETNTYPVEIFSEMHYAQSFRMQEPPRLAPPADSVVFVSAGDAGRVLDVPDKRERKYDPAVAGNLYRVNCSVCHGDLGDGEGKAKRHLISDESFYAITNGTAYGAPPSLIDSKLEQDVMVSFVTSGAIVMPSFGKLLPEEDIRDIVNYIFDSETGLR